MGISFCKILMFQQNWVSQFFSLVWAQHRVTQTGSVLPTSKAPKFAHKLQFFTKQTDISLTRVDIVLHTCTLKPHLTRRRKCKKNGTCCCEWEFTLNASNIKGISPFSTGGHVLQTLFPKPSDGGTLHPQCLCTASCFPQATAHPRAETRLEHRPALRARHPRLCHRRRGSGRGGRGGWVREQGCRGGCSVPAGGRSRVHQTTRGAAPTCVR